MTSSLAVSSASSEERKLAPTTQQPVKRFSIDERVVAFVQSIVDGFNSGVETIKKLSQLKQVIFLKGTFALAMTPFTLAAMIQTCRVFSGYSTEKKIDAGLTICDHLRHMGENAATVVVSLEGLRVIRRTPVAWAQPFAVVLSVLSIASIINNIRTYRKVKNIMREMLQIEENSKVEGKMTLAAYKSMIEVIEKKRQEDSDFVSEMFCVKEGQLELACASMERKIESQLSSENLEEVSQGQELLEKTVAHLKGRVKQHLVSSVLSTTSSVINMIGTMILLFCPIAPIGWITVGAAVLIDSSNWVRHKVVDYLFVKAMDIKRSKLEWVTS